MPHRSALLFLCAIVLAFPAWAQKKNDQLPERSETEILKTVTLPEGYEATVFARPPEGGYPTSVSAAVDGTIFVAIDENGSIGRDRNEPGHPRGRVIRMRDTKGDGHADEFKTFCEVESPRGVIWDGPKGNGPGVLYVMHPPNLTAYYDDTGDGVATRQEDILTGLGFDLGFRGADHTTNGCRLAIDGFIYIAMGDYGCINARGKDGRTLTHRGGGIVRIRPDGTGLELVVEGTRNIYDVAVSPTLDIFTRDNTNDGGGWNDRVSFHPPGAHMGYPMYFKNFPEDMIETMADFGDGAPCGSIWLDEPGLPKGLFTVEWGVGGIFYHDDLVPNGAGWKLANAATTDPTPAYLRPHTPQKKWLALTRPTDIDVDASGRLYITSWEGATFTYNGPNAGYVLRVVKKDAPKVEVPDIHQLTDENLVKLLASPSGTLRQAGQREILRRGNLDLMPDSPLLGKIPTPDPGQPTYEATAFAFINTLFEQFRTKGELPKSMIDLLDQPDSPETLKEINESETSVCAYLDAAGSHPELVKASALSSARCALRANSPRARAAALTALRRLGKSDAAPDILPLVADDDPIIAHLAWRALRELKVAQVCLSALDATILSGRAGVSPDPSAVAAGALKALYGMHDAVVVDGLIERLQRVANTPGGTPGAAGGTPTLPGMGSAPFDLRRGILNALCRLANQDAPYETPKVWWGTRPDTSGPIYQPIAWSETEKIGAALKSELERMEGSAPSLPRGTDSAVPSSEDDAKWLVQRMYQCKVTFPGLVELMLAKAGGDTPARLTAIEGMVRNDNSLPAEAVTALKGIATNENEAPELRARALRVFIRCAENGAVFPGAVEAFAPLAGHDLPDPKLTAVFEDFTRGAHNAKWVNDYNRILQAPDAAKRQLAATVLVNLATGRVGRENERESAKNAVTKSFDHPETAAALLTAIARSGAKPLAEQVKAHLNDPNNAVAEAALFAYQKLGLKDSGAPAQFIGTMKYDDIFPAVQKGGDAKEGQQMYLKAGCIACHTVSPDEPPKGPILSAVARIYDRAALTESILKPNAKIAQGFETQWFKTKKGEQIEGFVVREGGDSVDVRNVTGQALTLEKSDIAERGKRETSIMPEGLLNAFTPGDLQNLLAWLESLRGGK